LHEAVAGSLLILVGISFVFGLAVSSRRGLAACRWIEERLPFAGADAKLTLTKSTLFLCSVLLEVIEHCTKQSPCASVLARRDGYLVIFSATLINARYEGCLYRRMKRAGRLDGILPLYGFAEHSRRSTSARGIMIRPH
jgi:hypothetical protein